jgi:hypothetical protein
MSPYLPKPLHRTCRCRCCRSSAGMSRFHPWAVTLSPVRSRRTQRCGQQGWRSRCDLGAVRSCQSNRSTQHAGTQVGSVVSIVGGPLAVTCWVRTVGITTNVAETVGAQGRQRSAGIYHGRIDRHEELIWRECQRKEDSLVCKAVN